MCYVSGTRLFRCMLILLLLAGVAPGFQAAVASRPTIEDFDRSEVRRRIRGGLDFLLSRQGADGSFLAAQPVTEHASMRVGVSASCGLALLQRAPIERDERIDTAIVQLIAFLASQEKPSGLICETDDANAAASHGYATWFLARAHLLRGEGLVKFAQIESAAAALTSIQHLDGGWGRSLDVRAPSDLSNTVCVMMALSTCRQCGIAVSETIWNGCEEFITRCECDDGSFSILASSRRDGGVTSAAHGAVGLSLLERDRDQRLQRCFEYLSIYGSHAPDQASAPFQLYGDFYMSHVIQYAPKEQRLRWSETTVATLLRSQEATGAWIDPAGEEFGTALAVLVLSSIK